LAAAGCGDSDASEAAAPATDETRLGLLVPDTTSDAWDTLTEAALDEGRDSGIEISPDSAEDAQPSAQIAKVEAFAPEKLDCFAIGPVDSKALVAPLAAIAGKKVPIFNVGLRLDQKSLQDAGLPVASFIGPNDIEVGHQAARKMIDAVPAGSTVAMLLGGSADMNAADQRTGFREAAAGTLDVVLTASTEDDYTTAVNVVTDTISARPGLKGIFAGSDVMGRAATKAIADLGKTGSIEVISVGGTIEGLRAVQSGELTATVATYPASVGEVLVRACAQAAAGKAVKPRLTTQSWLVDKANVAAELTSYPRSTQPFPDPLV